MAPSIFKLLVGITVFFAGLLVLVLYLDLLPEHSEEGEVQEEKRPEISRKNEVRVFLPEELPTDAPVIVWWTPFTPYQRKIKTCPQGPCLFTQSRTELTNPAVNVSAFMFYASDLSWEDLPLPRRPNHLWALLHEESPKNNWILATEKGISLFNITSTISRYSDYPLHLHYLHTLDLLLQPIRTPTHLKSKNGLAPVIFLQSTCNPPSDRDSYVRELMKYIAVDSYGRCFHNKDLPAHLINPLTFVKDEVLDIVGKYKFILAFENAICHDYLTEKFWRGLYVGSVPVVRGSPTIRDWDPSSGHPSIILADDFDSPKALAEFLLELDKDDTRYDQYLSFKETGVTNQLLLDHFHRRQWVVDEVGEGENFIDGFECFVCNKLYERRKVFKPPQIVANSSHYHCLSPTPSVRRKEESLKESLKKMDAESRENLGNWMWHEKCAMAKGEAVWRAISHGLDQQSVNDFLHVACTNVDPAPNL